MPLQSSALPTELSRVERGEISFIQILEHFPMISISLETSLGALELKLIFGLYTFFDCGIEDSTFMSMRKYLGMHIVKIELAHNGSFMVAWPSGLRRWF